jgi:endonuclease/exonuclease/phosphatase family metal-dependent hydrolase
MKSSQTSTVTRRIAAATSAVCFGAVLATAPVVNAPTASAAGQTQLRVGSYNIRAGVGTSTFSSAVHGLMSQVDVAGLQEVNRHAKEDVLRRMRSQGFNYWRASKDHGEQSPIVWRSGRFRFVSAKSVRIAKRYYVGHEIKGRGTRTNRIYAAVVHLKDKVTGGNVSVINVHLLPGACINGGPMRGRPRTFKAFRASVIHLGRLAKAQKSFGRVYVLGDFNIGYKADKRVGRKHMPVRTFRRLRMTSMWATQVPSDKRGSHAGSPSLIDQVFAGRKASAATVRFDMTYSDHYPVIARYLVG